MGKWVFFLRGYWIMKIMGASPDWALNELAARRIPFWNLQWTDPMTVQICVFQRDLEEVRRVSQGAMCQAEPVLQIGLKASTHGIFRPVLLVGIVAALLLITVVPRYLLFFQVTGEETVPKAQIMQALEILDVKVGMCGPDVKPQWIKNHILQMLPQLQWITVTQNGCVAQVVVRERPETPQVIRRKGFANVVAARGGLIVSQSVLAGQPLKQVGDIVTEGELLVSGVVDLERVYSLQYAQAEIFARTWYKETVVTPAEVAEKTYGEESFRCVWLEFGKERIKIFGNSGISTVSCDKMISRKLLTLPGGYTLPVGVLVETYRPYSLRSAVQDKEQVRKDLLEHICERILSQAQAGELLESVAVLRQSGGTYIVSAQLECREMIARTAEAKLE